MSLASTSRGPARSRHLVGRALLASLMAGAVVAIAAGLGALTVADDRVGLLAAALIAIGSLVVVDPLLVAIAAFPATLLLQRAGSGGFGSSISVADLVIVLAVAVALPRVRWERARSLKAAMLPALAYEAITLATVLAHPNVHDSLEWAHRLEMVLGAIIVGWVVAASGRAKQAATALLVGLSVLAVLTIEHSFALHFQPAQWGAYQKNYLGSMMWMGAIIAHLNPPWLGMNHRFARVAKYLCVLGVLAAQAKQDIIALVVVIVLSAVLDPRVRHRSRILLAALAPLLVAGYFMLAAELSRSAQFNTVTARTEAFSLDFHIWLASPIFGEGMRWFYLPQFAGSGQPPDILFEALTDTGVVGVIAMLVLLVGSTRLFLSLPRSVGTIAVVLLVGRAVEALFDIYWVSPQTTLPWLVAGLALGAWDAGLAGAYRPPRRARAPLIEIP